MSASGDAPAVRSGMFVSTVGRMSCDGRALHPAFICVKRARSGSGKLVRDAAPRERKLKEIARWRIRMT